MILINCTEGGADIKGFKKLMLKDYIKKYVKNPIDKTIIKPLLSPRDDADDQIDKAISLIKKDWNILVDIAEECVKGKKTNQNIKNFMKTKEKTKKDEINWSIEDKKIIKPLFIKNREYSKKAQELSKQSPLISLAIYSASRAIASKKLNVKRNIKHVLTNKKDLETRLESNFIILDAAEKASFSLMKSYEEALDLLEKYKETKDLSLLLNLEPEEVNLNDADDYFKNGNFAHPLLDARQFINRYEKLSTNQIYSIAKLKKAKKIEEKALEMRQNAIDKAKEIDKDHLSKLLEYNDLIIESREVGKDRIFKDALKLIKKAKKLLPNKIMARWGIATTYHHIKEYDKSIKEYKKLIEDFPKKLILQYELGQVYLSSGNIKAGFDIISEVMQKTDKFDSFLKHIGILYYNRKCYKESLLAFEKYLEKYEADFEIWYQKSLCLLALDRKEDSKIALKRSKDLKNIESDKMNNTIINYQKKLNK